MRKWSIIAITLVVVGLALIISSRQTPIYESTARILVIPITGREAELIPTQNLNLATEAQLINSVAVAEIVAEELEFTGPPRDLLGSLSVGQPPDTEILEVIFRDPDPVQAQLFADAFADAYLRFREETVTEVVLSTAADIEAQIDLVTASLNSVNRELQGLGATDPRRGTLEAQAVALSTEILQLRVALLTLPEDVAVGQVIQPASFPSSPVSPNHVVNGTFGLVAGLGLGVGVAFLRDRLSERIRSSEELEAHLEAPVLASIPRVPWRRQKEPVLITAVQWRSPAAEAYRVLRTNVLSATSALDVKSIAVVSAYPGEGKSATTANLGVVLARAGQKVSLVSADLRRPRLHQFFERETQPGLVEVLRGHVTLGQALQTITLPTHGLDMEPPTLRLLACSAVPEDPTDLITSTEINQILGDLEGMSDIVLIDLPPLLPVTDALVIAGITRHVLLVIGPKTNTRPVITSVRHQLDRVGARILGAVLNGPHPTTAQTQYTY